MAGCASTLMSSPSAPRRHLAVMPAAGAGTRVGAAVPKQYLVLEGEPMIRRAAAALLAAPWIERLVVVVATGDERAAVALAGLRRTTILFEGGATRRDTVLAGLRALGRGLAPQVGEEAGGCAAGARGAEACGAEAGRDVGFVPAAATGDWVLVHDAARPGLDRATLERLREELADDGVGGLLAIPVGDTVKRAVPPGDAAGRAVLSGDTATRAPPPSEVPEQAGLPGDTADATARLAAAVEGGASARPRLPRVLATVPRDDLWLAQTPQMFRFGLLRDALERFEEVTDEASAIELAGHAPKLVVGATTNFKVTSNEDMALMRRLLQSRKRGAMSGDSGMDGQSGGARADGERKPQEPSRQEWKTASDAPTGQEQKARPVSPTRQESRSGSRGRTRPSLRIGQGYDVHALVPGRALIVGGMEVPHTHGLLGHSDADVLLHAITDAILGAAGLGDIGRHFPDDDLRFAGADSLRLLREANRRVAEAGYRVVNLDSTIIAQAPKMAPYIVPMTEAIAAALEIAVDLVNVKAKTAERLGFAGRGEGIAAEAIALIEERGDAERGDAERGDEERGDEERGDEERRASAAARRLPAGG